MVAALHACLEIFYGFVARLLQPTFTTKWAWARPGWAGLGWACHSLAAEYIGAGLLLLLTTCSPLGWGWSGLAGTGAGAGWRHGTRCDHTLYSPGFRCASESEVS